VKLPFEFAAEVESLGKKVAAETITRDEGAQTLAEMTFLRANRPLLESIVFGFWRARINSWITGYLKTLTDDEREEATGQRPLFSWLPDKIEVAPSRWVHQNALTAKDLRNALTQAMTKANNARGYAERIKRLADAALPLMNDEATTLSDIAEQVENRLAGVPLLPVEPR
jgi:hypothetical protein